MVIIGFVGSLDMFIFKGLVNFLCWLIVLRVYNSFKLRIIFWVGGRVGKLNWRMLLIFMYFSCNMIDVMLYFCILGIVDGLRLLKFCFV